MSHRAVCFVIMPFGKKPDVAGQIINFDAIHKDIIAPAIDEAGLLSVRADEEMSAGFIHKLMYERLIFSEFAVADLTILNANVYYELGIRHAARPSSTVLISAASSRLPFDVGPLRALPYDLDAGGNPRDAAASKAALVQRLHHCRQHRENDSPLFDLLDGYTAPPIDREKTDVFRERVAYSTTLKQKLNDARKTGVDALDQVRDELGDIDTTEAGVAVDLLLSYRAIDQYERMVALTDRMDVMLARTVMIREQRAFALNRIGRGDEAEAILKQVIAERGPSSETYGLLGRVYKDRWENARKVAQPALARGLLKQAINAYRSGFEADWRDAYPGINAVTLMAIANPADPAIDDLATVVRYAVERRIARSVADYWDHATLLELAALRNDLDAAEELLSDVLTHLRGPFEARTTARNLQLIADAQAGHGQQIQRLSEIVQELAKAGRATHV